MGSKTFIRNLLVLVVLQVFFLCPVLASAQESPSPVATGEPAQATPGPGQEEGKISEDIKEVEKEEVVDPRDLIQKIWEINNRMINYEARITINREDPNFMKGIFPSMDDSQYLQADGIINYSKSPKIFNLLLYEDPEREGSYFYRFSSIDGYHVNLDDSYQRIFKTEKEKLTPEVLEEPFQGELLDPQEAIRKYTTPIGIAEDGTLEFSSKNPLNLLFPFSFKTYDPRRKVIYRGMGMSNGYSCHKVEIISPVFGRTMVYISDEENNYIRQIDRINERGVIYATCNYSNFKMFRKGGWLYQTARISIFGHPVLTAEVRNYLSNQDSIKMPGRERVATEAEAVARRPRHRRNTQILTFGPVITVATAMTVLILLIILVILMYRFWFYKAERPAFAREIIVVEGERPEEKISHVFADIGVPTTPFTSEKLTEDRKLLDFKKKKKPRILAVGPGMFPRVKAYNFLLKAFVEDGGRVIIFEHGVEHASDMPFTPTFVPYDRSDPNFNFIVMPKWEKIWNQTSLEEIQKRTAAFYPYELMVRVKEKSLRIDPIIIVNNPKINLTAAAICMIYEGKGEYMVVQYRLLEAIQKLKFTSATAEKMLRDLLSYMFGREKRMELLPPWFMSLLGKETSAST